MSESTEKFRLPGLEKLLRGLLRRRGPEHARKLLDANFLLLEQDRDRGMPEEEYRATGAELARIHRAVFGETPPEEDAP